jgi:hypothetical protein
MHYTAGSEAAAVVVVVLPVTVHFPGVTVFGSELMA